MKVNFKITLLLLSLLSFVNNAYAEWSYAGKFLATTAAGCAVGGAGSYFYANGAGYDTQPRAIVTWMGAATGCLTGALFSYLFYDDDSKTLAQVNEQLTATNNRLQLELQKSANNSSFGVPLPSVKLPDLNSTLNSFKIAKMESIYEMDVKTNPTIADCSGDYYSIWLDSNGYAHSAKKDERPRNLWIPVSPNLAMSSWQFIYSSTGCFKPHPSYDYFEKIVPGLARMLENQIVITAKNNPQIIKVGESK
ncbi:hypothetical protein GCL60_09795 [Silvanigrella paludirubra]|uniref:Uncharacterized protein n=1 Tax=Silvanigrella paludirubra TaxID=2499159 RepID=A0A6N6VTD4_9BACT|nr:hypothetical protein [Silvanigrella paludirubra]KAB8039138.1 hypothetical protein GCL60_09795 [Silvanigrella paludirubra]